MNMLIEESGMFFKVEADCVFCMENCEFVSSLNGYKKVEFVHLIDSSSTLRFVEAKTSVENKEKQIGSIVEKFKQSVEIVYALILRYGGDNLPKSFKLLDLSNINLSFYLVVKNIGNDGKVQVHNSIKSKLSSFCRCWNINSKDIKVFDEKKAQEKGIIE